MAVRLSKRQSLIAAGVAVVVLGGGGAIAAVTLTGNDSKPKAAPATTASSATPTPKPTPTVKPKPKPPAPVNPLTGIGPPPAGPVIAVKIDDTENGRPQVGLDQADIVYIEQVEGGLTRMAAVFATHKPVVEPVRSVRASDSELLRQYGRIILVASGGGGLSLPTLDKSGMAGVINDRGGPGFSRDGGRGAPYNLSSNLSQVAAAVKADGPKDVGFKWSAHDVRVTKAPAAPAINTVVGSTGVSFQWNTGLNRYVRTLGGQPLTTADGAPVSTPNVLVQFCQVAADYADVDVMGNPSAMTNTVGSGRVVLFRNGHRVEGKWSRASVTAATSFTDLAGKPLLLQPGGAYVVLAANGSPV